MRIPHEAERPSLITPSPVRARDSIQYHARSNTAGKKSRRAHEKLNHQEAPETDSRPSLEQVVPDPGTPGEGGRTEGSPSRMKFCPLTSPNSSCYYHA